MAIILNIYPKFTARPRAYPEGNCGVLHESETWSNMPVSKFIYNTVTGDEFINFNVLKASVYL
jgi:hypothetical protein